MTDSDDYFGWLFRMTVMDACFRWLFRMTVLVTISDGYFRCLIQVTVPDNYLGWLFRMLISDDCSRWLFRILFRCLFLTTVRMTVRDSTTDLYFSDQFIFPRPIRISTNHSADWYHDWFLFLNDGFLLQNYGPNPPWYVLLPNFVLFLIPTTLLFFQFIQLNHCSCHHFPIFGSRNDQGLVSSLVFAIKHLIWLKTQRFEAMVVFGTLSDSRGRIFVFH